MPAKKKAVEPKPNPIVEAVWEGRAKYFPDEDRIVEPGDVVHVTQEQLDDPNTPCSAKPARGKKTTSSAAAEQTED